MHPACFLAENRAEIDKALRCEDVGLEVLLATANVAKTVVSTTPALCHGCVPCFGLEAEAVGLEVVTVNDDAILEELTFEQHAKFLARK